MTENTKTKSVGHKRLGDMRRGGGKAKGASFEREVCKQLSLWISQGKNEDVFWRSAMSGGRSTVAARKGKRLAQQAGDISCISPVGQAFIDDFFIECKCYKSLNFEGLITGRGKLVEFWNIAKREAALYGKSPLLIAKQNNQPAIVCLDEPHLLHLDFNTILYASKLGMHVCLFDEFLRNAIVPQ